jgi:hypothetical protein
VVLAMEGRSVSKLLQQANDSGRCFAASDGASNMLLISHDFIAVFGDGLDY